MVELNGKIFQNPFEVSVNLEDEHHQLMVIPGYCNENHHSIFLILLDGVSLGEILMDLNTGWYWSVGNLTKEHAESIGNKIEKHYN